MKSSIVKIALIAAALLMAADQSLAAASKAEAAAAPKSKASATSATGAKPKSKAATANIKLVDINSATTVELKKLPGVGDAEAGKIIAGRPYLSKAFLVTHKIISEADYQRLRTLIVARQKGVAKPK